MRSTESPKKNRQSVCCTDIGACTVVKTFGNHDGCFSGARYLTSQEIGMQLENSTCDARATSITPQHLLVGGKQI